MSLLNAAIDACVTDAEYVYHRDACAAARKSYEQSDDKRDRIAAGIHADRMRRAFERILARLIRPEAN